MSRRFKKARGLVEAFVNAFVPDILNKTTETYLYGKDNQLPNQLISFIADSGVAARAVGKVAEYIASDGFTNEASADFMVNQYQTADKLLQEQSLYMAYVGAVAFHVSRKGGKVVSVKSIPIQCLRKKADGTFLYNETFGQPKYDKTKDIIYPAYYGVDLPTTLLTSPQYINGEVLYVWRKTPLNSYYSIPDYYAGIHDILTSTEISKMDYELSINGFMPSAIVNVCGDIDDSTKDENGKTEADYYREQFKVFTGQEKDSSGKGTRFKAMLQFAKTADERTTIETLDIKSILEASNSKRDLIERAVCRLMGVHPVLLGYSDAAVLGNTQALANASLELNKVVNPYQRMITEAFEMLYPNMDWSISEYMPINYIDPALYDRMTEDELRNKLLGLPPKETDATGEGDKIVKALNSLSPLVANKVLESLDENEIRSLIGLWAKVQQPTQPNNGAVN